MTNMTKLYMLLSLLSLSFASLNLSLSDQGAGVRYLNGTLVPSADLTVYVFTTPQGGTPLWSHTYAAGIINGTWNVMLENVSLEFNQELWKDYFINSDNMSFDGEDRIHFFSPLGDINSSDLARSINLSNATGYNYAQIIGRPNILCPAGEVVQNITDGGSQCVASSVSEIDPRWSANDSTVARIGSCPAGQVVQNTTTSGVQCVSPLFSFTETDPLWSGNSSTVARTGTCTGTNAVQTTTTGGVTCIDIRAQISGTAPVSYSSSTGAISMAQATGSVDGFLDSADWTTFNNKAGTGTATCGPGTVVQNVTTSSSGVTTQCVTDQTGGGGGTSFAQYNYTTADVTSTSTTVWTPVMHLDLTTGKAVIIDCSLMVNTGAAATGIQAAVNYTGTSERRILTDYYTSATAKAVCGWTTATGSCLGATSAGATVTPYFIEGYSVQSSGGKFNLSLRSETGTAVTVLEGSFCRSVEKP